MKLILRDNSDGDEWLHARQKHVTPNHVPGVRLYKQRAYGRSGDKMVLETEGYDKFIFATSSSLELNGVDLAELLRRRDELRFLALQCDPEKATEDLRYSCIKGELAEVERKLSVFLA